MFEITVCPIKKLYSIAADADLSDVGAIIVSSFDVNENKLGNLGRHIILHFADTEELRDDTVTEGDADLMLKFIDELPRNTDTLFVCCDSGESRSTAIAAAISRYKGLDEWLIWDNPRYHPNGLVYKKICEGFGITVMKRDIELRKERNQSAFRRSMGS